ncbi:MAG: SRPBCC family protein [Myxococcota bacterium]
MLKKILAAVAVLLVVFVVVVATRPAEFEIKRTSAPIKAPAAVVYAQVVDFKAWGAWSPWEKLDPAMKRTFAGAAAGLGAKYAWDGEKAGAGSMEIIEATEGRHVGIDLQFTRPFPASNPTSIDFAQSGDGTTTVTWKMTGKNGFMSKAFGLFVDLDKMVGADFENGLAAMKSVAEKAAAEAEKKAADEAAAAAAAAPTPDAGTP